MTTIYQVI